MSDLLEAPDEAAAVEALHELGCTDGLPVIVPTPERVAAMVLASGLDPDLVIGTMGPGGGTATVEKLAVAAVMAGALPDTMPVVLGAARAIIDPRFDLTEMQATTHCTAPIILVNGPAREALGIASGFGALGPGHRANATIGRALRLAMMNIGGAKPGASDMALLGHPGKFTYCLAEAEEQSPFPPLHVALGFQPEDSVVTVMGAEAPHSVLYSPEGDPGRDAVNLSRVLAAGLTHLGTNNAVLRGGTALVVLNPEHAAVYAQAGWDRGRVQTALYEACTVSADQLIELAGGFAPKDRAGERLHCFRQAEDILVMVAGGSGLYSMVMPTWCAGAHRNPAVSVAVDLNPFCEVPGL